MKENVVKCLLLVVASTMLIAGISLAASIPSNGSYTLEDSAFQGLKDCLTFDLVFATGSHSINVLGTNAAELPEFPVYVPVADLTLDITRQHGSSAVPVPEPATILLFGTGLIGLAGVCRRMKNKSSSW